MYCLKVEEEDVLQYVRGIEPGKYVTSEDETWVKGQAESNIKVRKQNLKDEYAALCSSTVNSDEDVSDLLDSQPNINQRNDMVNSFYQLVTQQVPSTVTVADLRHNVTKDPTAPSAVVSVQQSILGSNEHFAYGDDSSRLFGDLKGNVIPSINVAEPAQLTLKTNDDSSLTVNYIPQSFSPSHALNFDSLVDSVDDDLMNAFPISLPMLSDNSTDSKDYGDILNSLKGIECTAGKSTIPDFQDPISSINAAESTPVDLLSSLKNMDSGDKGIINGFRSTVINDLTESSQTSLLDDLKDIGQKSVIRELGSVMSERMSEHSQMDLLGELKNMNNSDNSAMVQIQNTISNSLSESPCIMDFTSLDSNFP